MYMYTYTYTYTQIYNVYIYICVYIHICLYTQIPNITHHCSNHRFMHPRGQSHSAFITRRKSWYGATSIGLALCQHRSGYPLVFCNIAMENNLFYWVNPPLSMVIFHFAMFVYRRIPDGFCCTQLAQIHQLTSLVS